MDSTREARRSTMATSNGVTRRRQRSSGMDDGHAEMQQEGLRLRDRPEKKERDRDPLNRSKRRRSERFVQRNERDVEEDSSYESLGDDDIPLSQNSTSFQHNYLRKSFPPTRLPRRAAADEMIGVPVPRKARSVCVKRPHDCRTSSGSGGGEDHRGAPASPASHSFEAVSPSSSNVSVKPKMQTNGSVARALRPPKSSGAAEDELEIEIAEVLSGLKKQPRGSGKEDDSENSLKPAEFKVITTDSKMKETEGGDSSAHVVVENGSITSTAGCALKMEISMEKPEKLFGLKSESHPTARTEATEPASTAGDMQNEILKQEKLGRPDGVDDKDRLDLRDSTTTKEVSEGPESKAQREEGYCNKFEIDLMVAPPMPSSPERDSLGLESDPKPIAHNYNNRESLLKDRESIIVKKETASGEAVERKVEVRGWLKLDLGKPGIDADGDTSLRLQDLGQSQRQLAKSAQQNSLLPLPNGMSPLGYVPPFQAIKTVERVGGSSPMVQAAPFSASQPRPKRCATHYFIARNIQLHQQFVKTSQHWPLNTSSVSLNCGGSKPNNLYAIPPTTAEGLVHGNPSLRGSFPVLSLNSLAQDKGSIAAYVPSHKDKVSESCNLAETKQKKLQPPSASGNLLSAPAFIFPASNNQQPVIGTADQSGLSPSGTQLKNPSMPRGPASVSFSHQSSSASESSPYYTILPNHGFTFQVSSPPTVGGGAPGQALPFYSGSFYAPQMFQSSQLQPKQSQVHRETNTSIGSSSSQKHLNLQVGGNSTLTSARVQKLHLQPTHHQSQTLETKTSGEKSSLASESWGSHCQKSAYGQNMTGPPPQPLNFSMSFASFCSSGSPSNLNFSSNGNHIVPAPQAIQQKSHQVRDSKTGGSSNNLDDPKRALLVKPPALTNGQTLAFDNSARNLSFASGGRPARAATLTTINSNPLASISLPNSQQHPTQKQNMLQQQQQQQQQSGRSKLMATNAFPAVSLGSKFPSCSVSVSPHAHAQANPVPAKSARWRSPETSSSLASCRSLNLKTSTQGQNQISFAGNPNPLSVLPSLVAAASPHSKTDSTGSTKAATAAQQQEAENSAGGSNQKSSPVCGRNVPSIIISRPGHTSELKY